MGYIECPRCKARKWATISDPNADWRKPRQLLNCNNCGFNVDTRIVVQARRILRRDAGGDTTADNKSPKIPKPKPPENPPYDEYGYG